MGRQAYLNRLALGRSPYEAPDETASEGEGSPSTRYRIPALYGDGYVQHYDERGHPINPESRALGRNLRRAKNDILSTMGIVVSGEGGNDAVSKEQQKVDQISAENDYGTIMSTLDQALAFLGTWWTTSLTNRIQTFKRYTHAPLMRMMKFERASVGILGFYFAGFPAWTLSTSFSLLRHHPLDRMAISLQIGLLRLSPSVTFTRLVRWSCSFMLFAAKKMLLVLAVQSYMYSLSQSLHLVHPYSLPGPLLIPFGEMESMQFPPLPADLSLHSVSQFGLGLLKAPPLLVYTYVWLRPIVELRLYRLIRRRLPKPAFADEASIRVALDRNLINWMVPTLGRMSEEENTRHHLTLSEDITQELIMLRTWASMWFGLRQAPASGRGTDVPPEDQASQSIDELAQYEMGTDQHRANLSQLLTQHRDTPGEHTSQNGQDVPSNSPRLPGPAQLPGVDSEHGRAQNVSQPPDRISGIDLSDGARFVPPTGPRDGEDTQNEDGRRHHSRTNTLFSRPSSPATSPPTSPRVRASLIHQNSDIITMQLELLNHRNEENPDRTATGSGEIETSDANGLPADRRSVAEFLDYLISSHNQNLTVVSNSDAVGSDGLSGMTAVAPVPGPGDHMLGPQQNTAPEPSLSVPPVETPIPAVANVLPDSVEEPDTEAARQPEAESLGDNLATSGQTRRTAGPTSLTHGSNPPSAPHRVTLLSSLPMDSLASQLSSIITGVMFIPLESLYLRSLASSFHSSRGSHPALRSDVRALGAWAGGGSWSDMVAYMGKIELMTGLQAIVNASVWGIFTGAAMRLGKRYCGWGTL